MDVRHAKDSPPWTVLAFAGDIAVAISHDTRWSRTYANFTFDE